MNLRNASKSELLAAAERYKALRRTETSKLKRAQHEGNMRAIANELARREGL